jgi:hypothetical protein
MNEYRRPNPDTAEQSGRRPHRLCSDFDQRTGNRSKAAGNRRVRHITRLSLRDWKVAS